MYKFRGDKNQYTCYMTYEQYTNFRELSIVEKCKVIEKNKQNYENYKNEIQKALDLAMKNDTSHMCRLSECV